jgi:hypothetical protein
MERNTKRNTTRGKSHNKTNRNNERINRQRAKPHKQYVRNPGGTSYYKEDAIYQRKDRRDRHKHHLDLDEKVVNSSDDGFEQPSDEDAQGNVISIHKMDIDAEDDITQMPNKADAKPSP